MSKISPMDVAGTVLSRQMDMSVDIVIPVYNEGTNIISVLQALKAEVKTAFRILICYDFPEDNTLTAIAELSPDEIHIVPVLNPGRGPHSAVRAGLAASTAPAVLVYMADDDYNANLVDVMFEHYKQGSDVVAASRFMPGGCMEGCSSKLKELIARMGAVALHSVAGAKVHDPTNGFRLFSRRLIEAVEIESEFGFTYSVELLVKAVRLRWPVAEVPAKWFERGDRPSRFKVLTWLPHYLRWLFYALATVYLFRSPGTVKRQSH